MSYLDRLKNLDSGKRSPTELPKLPKPLLTVKTVATRDVSGKQGAASFDHEWFDERAAIYEFDAGFTREEAERRVLKEVTKWLH